MTRAPCAAGPLGARRPRRRVWLLALLLGLLWPSVRSQPGGTIYTCVDDRGRRITSDRPIPECLSREQRILNRDGSLKAVRPPSLSADERTEREARERRAAQARAQQEDAARRDRNLLQRYPDEAAHLRAREAALAPLRAAQRAARSRQEELGREREPLLAEAEFYRGKALPPRLKGRLDANDAALAALRDTAVAQDAEAARINRLYDTELERLRRLWAGAAAGSLGPLEASSDAASAPAGAAAGARRQ